MRLIIRLLKILKMLYCDDFWRVGGYILPPSIFFIFKYVNKQLVFVSKMGIKVTYAFQIKSYEHFKFQKSKI